ncbi:MAG: CehA/McbA family metallohydrolase [Sphingomonas sp.]
MRARTLARVVLPLLLVTGAAATAGAQDKAVADRDDIAAAPYRTLTGVMTRADFEHYREIPFDLPAGVTRLTVRFSYGGKDQHAAIDMGLEDPARFRGWSGGSRDQATLSVSEATPGYLPGPLPAGRWHLLLGVPNVRAGARAPYKAEIFIERAPGITEFADAPLDARPGWYRGDLHMHSGNSDGKCLSQSGRKVGCPVYRTVAAAAARGLDFIALTDHNTISQFDAERALQPAFDKLLLVPGREITTFFGHANVFGLTDFLDWRMTAPTYGQTAKWMAAAERAGGIVSLNHPGVPSGERCMGCGWGVGGLPPHAVSAVEVVNGGTLAATGSADNSAQGFGLWEKLLDRGEHVTGIDGSDNYDADIPADKPGAIGTPTTVVYMHDLSVHGLLDGLRSGRVFIDVDGTRDRVLDLSAMAGSERAEMGQTLHPQAGATVQFAVALKGVTRGTVQLVTDGRADAAERVAFDADHPPALPSWQSDGKAHWVRADVRDARGRLVLIGNPIYIAG